MIKFDLKGWQRETGRLLARERKYEGMSQEKLAKQIGMERATLANIERGRQRIPADVLWRAAVVLKLGIEAFVPESIGHK